jgi:hypothetical protein
VATNDEEFAKSADTIVIMKDGLVDKYGKPDQVL